MCLCQFINIHQRTKTRQTTFSILPRISLSISIREPKQFRWQHEILFGISLSISIREPKRRRQLSLSYSVSVYQYPSENQNYAENCPPCTIVSVYQYPSENQNLPLGQIKALGYQFINIHQRTKTGLFSFTGALKYQFINIHQRTKTSLTLRPDTSRISLSISIREPKLAVSLKRSP